MPNAFAGAFSALRSAYQGLTGAIPTITFGEEVVDIIPGERGIDPTFVLGGEAEGSTLTVQTLESDWTQTAPAKHDVVAIAGHPNAPDGNYQVLKSTHKEGTLLFDLGNMDTNA